MKNISCEKKKASIDFGIKCIRYLRWSRIAFIINFLIALFIVMFEKFTSLTVLLYLSRSIFFINIVIIGLCYSMAVKNAYCCHCHKRIPINRNNILRILSSTVLFCDNCCIDPSKS